MQGESSSQVFFLKKNLNKNSRPVKDLVSLRRHRMVKVGAKICHLLLILTTASVSGSLWEGGNPRGRKMGEEEMDVHTKIGQGGTMGNAVFKRERTTTANSAPTHLSKSTP